MTSLQLKEAQGTAFKQYKALAEKRGADGKFADSTDEAAFRKCADDLDSFEERILEAEKHEMRLKKMIEAEQVDEKLHEERHNAGEHSEKRTSYDIAFGRYLTRAQNATLPPEDMRILETRGTNTQITSTNSLGGYLVPQSFSTSVEKAHAHLQETPPSP